MNETMELVHQEQRPIARRTEQPDIGAMLRTIIDKGVTGENVKAMESLVRLYEHMEARDAEREFNQAFVNLQREIPKVQADKVVPDGKGGVLYTYCSYEEIHKQAQPIMTANGFSVRFSQRMEPEGLRVVITCYLMHQGGHTVSNEYAVRSGRGAPGMNETKCDTSAGTIAQREAFCDALNVVRRGRDDNAALEGAKITAEQAHSLEERVKATGSDMARFLAFAGAKTFAEISSTRYSELDASLRRKEKTT